MCMEVVVWEHTSQGSRRQLSPTENGLSDHFSQGWFVASTLLMHQWEVNSLHTMGALGY